MGSSQVVHHLTYVSAALAEFFAPTTPPARRHQLQLSLQQERSRDGAWRDYLPLLTASLDEALLWLALSVCDASLLRARGLECSSAADRSQLKDALLAMLLGPRRAALPPSARGKAVGLLARLARVAWPREEPRLVPQLLECVQQRGGARAHAAEAFAAICDEVAPTAARSLAFQQEQLQDDFCAILPLAHASLAAALSDQPGAEECHAEAAYHCLRAAAALLRLGWTLRPSGGAAAELPKLLRAVCLYIEPLKLRHAAEWHLRLSSAALEAIRELCERQEGEQAAGTLLAGVIGALVDATRALPKSAPQLSEPARAEYERQLCYTLELLSSRWLLRLNRSLALAILGPLWVYSQGAAVRQLHRCVRVSVALLECAGAAAEGLASNTDYDVTLELVDALMPCVQALVGRLQLRRNPQMMAEYDLDAEVQLLEDDDDDEGEEGAGEELLGGGTGEEEGFEALCSDSMAQLCAMATVRGDTIVQLLFGELRQVLPSVATASPEPMAATDVSTLCGLLVGVLPSVSDASIGALAELTAALLEALRRFAAPAAPLGRRSRAGGAAERAELALLRLLLSLCDWMDALLDGAAAAWPAAQRDGVGRTLADAASALFAHAPSLLAAGGAARPAAALLSAGARRHWSAAAHEAAALQQLRAIAPAAIAQLPEERQPALCAAVACALLLPARGAKMEAYAAAVAPWRREGCARLVEALCGGWASGAAEGALGRVGAAHGSMRCLCAVLRAFANEHRAVKARGSAPSASRRSLTSPPPPPVPPPPWQLALLEPMHAPLLVPLQSLLPAVISAAPLMLESVGELLQLVLALLQCLGGLLGSPLLLFAFEQTLSAVSTVVAASATLASPEPHSPNRPGSKSELVLRVGLRILLVMSDPPAQSAAIKASVLSPLVAVIGPSQIGSLVHDSPGQLSPPRCAQVFSIVANVLKVHWRALSQSHEQLAVLLQMMFLGLSRPHDVCSFRICLSSCLEVQDRKPPADPSLQEWLLEQFNELLYMVLAVRLDPRHSAFHEEATECLRSARTEQLVALLQRFLVAQDELSAAQKQMVYDQFVAGDNGDAPSFSRNLGRLANDVAYFKMEALHSSTPLF
ncbi:hypothetical protein AB1Y20_007701 [Prymnesium parvum]|uniref:Uncharacterized protein n=1 Tax=Prymnesium parvum TaxID=97485 RepID=A0AB34IWU7_PRYPA